MADKKIIIETSVSTDKIKQIIEEVKNLSKVFEEFKNIAKGIKGVDTEFESINKSLDRVFNTAVANLGSIKKKIDDLKLGKNVKLDVDDFITKASKLKETLKNVGDEYSQRIDLSQKFLNTLSAIEKQKEERIKNTSISNLTSIKDLYTELSGSITKVFKVPIIDELFERTRQSAERNIKKIDKTINDLITGKIGPEKADTIAERLFGKAETIQRITSSLGTIGSVVQQVSTHYQKSVGILTELPLNMGKTFDPIKNRLYDAKQTIETIVEKIDTSITKTSSPKSTAKTLDQIISFMKTPETQKKLSEVMSLPTGAEETLLQLYGRRFGGYLYQKAVDITEAREAATLANKWIEANKKIADPALVTAVERWRNNQELIAHGLRSGELTVRNFTISTRILKEDIKDLVFWQARWYGSKFLLFTPLNWVSNAVKDFISFQKQMIITQAVTQMTDAEMSNLNTTINSLTSRLPVSHEELAKASLILAKAGLSGETLNKALEATSKLSTATATDLKTAAGVMISFTTAWNLSGTDIERVANILMVAANKTKMDIKDVVYLLNYVTGAAKAANVSIEDLVSVFSALSQVLQPSTAATGLRTFMVEILEGQDRVRALMDRAGIGFANARDMMSKGQLIPLIKLLAESNLTVSEVFKGLQIRAGSAATTLKAVLPYIEETKSSMFDLYNLDNAVAKVSDAFDNKIKIMSNNLKTLLFPAINAVTSILGVLVSGLTTAIKSIGEFWVVFASVGAALVIANLSTVIAQLKTIFELLKNMVAFISTKLGVIGWILVGATVLTSLAYKAHERMKNKEESFDTEEFTYETPGVVLRGKKSSEYKLREKQYELEQLEQVTPTSSEEVAELIFKKSVLQREIDSLLKTVTAERLKREESDTDTNIDKTLNRISSVFRKQMVLINRNLRNIIANTRIKTEELLLDIDKKEKLGLDTFTNIVTERQNIRLEALNKEEQATKVSIVKLQNDYASFKSELDKIFVDSDRKKELLDLASQEYEENKKSLENRLKEIELEKKKIKQESDLSLVLERLKVNYSLLDISLDSYNNTLQLLIDTYKSLANTERNIFGNTDVESAFETRKTLLKSIYDIEEKRLLNEKERNRNKLLETLVLSVPGTEQYERAYAELNLLDKKFNAELFKNKLELANELFNIDLNSIESRTSINTKFKEAMINLGLDTSNSLYKIEKDKIEQIKSIWLAYINNMEQIRVGFLKKELEREDLLPEEYDSLYGSLINTQKYYNSVRSDIENRTTLALTDLNIKYISDVSRAYETGGFIPALKLALTKATSEFRDWGKNIEAVSTSVINSLQTGLDNFFDYTSQGFLDWRNLVISVLNDIYKAMVKNFIINPLIGSIFKFNSGASIGVDYETGLSYNVASGANTYAAIPIQHQGGYVYKFHTGGLSHDEVPAILQKGEYVVSRKGVDFLDKINSGNLNSNPNIQVNIINQTNTPITATPVDVSINAEKIIINTILKNLSNMGDLYQSVRRIK